MHLILAVEAVHVAVDPAAAKRKHGVALLKHADNRLHSETLAVVAKHVASDPAAAD